MNQVYLIDGYNLLHAMGVLNGLGGPHLLERARTSFLDTLASSFGEKAAQLTVVFDAAVSPRGVQAALVYRRIHVRFAKGRLSADDLIEDLIVAETNPKQLVVVSSDHRLQRAAQRRQAQAMDCGAFLDLLHSQPAAQSADANPTEESDERQARPSRQEVEELLEEFKDLQAELDRRDEQALPEKLPPRSSRDGKKKRPGP